MPKPRVLVIGLDGATWDLIRPWADSGRLPHFAELLDESCCGNLMSTIPPISPAAWSTFMTGKNPGKHGVFDFTLRDYEGYGMRVAQRPSEPTLWGLLSAQGRTVCVVNVPQTYPPEQVRGTMVTGLGTPSQRVFTYPAELTGILRKENYRINTEAVLHRDGAARYIEGVYEVAEQVTDTALRLMSRSDWDFSMVTLRLTDEIPHFFWHWMDSEHPAHESVEDYRREAVLQCYQKADELIGRLISAVSDSNTTVLVMSDHGFGPLHKDVYLNEWLRKEGFLHLRSRVSSGTLFRKAMKRLGLTRTHVGHTLSRWGLHWLRGSLRDRLGRWAEVFPNDAQSRVADVVDWDRTRAYSVGYIGQVYINLAGRDPSGTVAPGQEYEQFREMLYQRLREMVDPVDGLPVVDHCFRKEEVYSGRYVPDAPDLLLIMRGLRYITRQSYEFSREATIFAPAPTHETGGHRLEGIMLAIGAQIAGSRWTKGARIEDVAPTVLYLLGCDVPSDMDGKVLVDILDPEVVASRPISHSDAELPQDEVDGLTAEEEEDLLEHLRNLGYVS